MYYFNKQTILISNNIHDILSHTEEEQEENEGENLEFGVYKQTTLCTRSMSCFLFLMYFEWALLCHTQDWQSYYNILVSSLVFY